MSQRISCLVVLLLYREFALFRATCPDVKWRDGKKAVELATAALDKAGKAADWEYHSVLAAAHAESGDFDRAVKAQEKLIGLLNSEKKLDPDELKKAADRVTQYKAKKPFRDE